MIISRKTTVIDITPSWWTVHHDAPSWTFVVMLLGQTLRQQASEQERAREIIGLFADLHISLRHVAATMEVPESWTDADLEARRLALVKSLDAVDPFKGSTAEQMAQYKRELAALNAAS